MTGLAITAFMPSITSSGIFSSRRANTGVDAIASNNPFVGVMNLDVAGGQITNAAKGVVSIAKESKNAVSDGIISAEKSIKDLANSGKIARGVSKVLSFTADNINPIICATSAVKVLSADDKTDTAIQEGVALGSMFAAERTAKELLGMPKTMSYNPEKMVVEKDGLYKIKGDKKELIAKNGNYNIINNEKVVVKRDAILAKSPFFNEQKKALQQFCETKTICNKSLKFLPGTLKGLAFVAASISGYKLGTSAADMIVKKSDEVKRA